MDLIRMTLNELSSVNKEARYYQSNIDSYDSVTDFRKDLEWAIKGCDKILKIYVIGKDGISYREMLIEKAETIEILDLLKVKISEQEDQCIIPCIDCANYECPFRE